jgi:hypothetical protein
MTNQHSDTGLSVGSLIRIVGLAAAWGLAVAILIRRPARRLNRLFLLEPAYGKNMLARAAVATIGPNTFQIERSYAFAQWAFVTSAANGGNKWLLFHNLNGSAATGLIDDDYVFRQVKYYPPGSLSDFPFPNTAVVDGRGYLLATGRSPDNRTVAAFAQVLDDGSYVEWWRTALSDFQLPYLHKVIGLQDSHLVYSNDNSGGSTVYVFDIKHARVLSSRQWGAPLKGVVAEGNLIYLYFDDSIRTTELCVLDTSRQLVTLKRTEFDFDLSTVPFDRIASTPGAHLLYSYQSLDAPGAIRVLDQDGFKLTKRLSGMDWRWFYYVRC